ncbi:DNA ligase 1-like [Palaemon carinicauda]|uniref:DNA ligase 1-like n=1 Tax=Palaemon carinicauda TaxID=392227 RepID=UPI0035B6177D
MESKVIIPPTLPTFGHSTVYIYPTVSPKVVVVPILTCIFGFPVLVLLIICALRRRARRARTTAKKTRMKRDPCMQELASGPSILANRCKKEKEPRTSFKKKKTLVRFKPMPEIDLDTVVEEKSEFDAEVTASDLLTTPEEFVIPEEETHSASFRSYRYMGTVQTANVPGSPHNSPLAIPGCSYVAEELESHFDYDDLDDDYDDENIDHFENEETQYQNHKRFALHRSESRVDGSSASSDSDTPAVCFSLSPKQGSKSPTAMHLALKKLDGVMSRRHSSPVKINYGANRPNRSSGKVNFSYSKEEEVVVNEKEKNKEKEDEIEIVKEKEKDKEKEKEMEKEREKQREKERIQLAIDYIDRELMPDIEISTRSYSVRNPSRKSQSFCSKRRGESFKLKKQSLARSISHKLSSSQENVKKTDMIEMDQCSSRKPLGKSLSVGATRSSAHSSISHCELRTLEENGESSNNIAKKEADPGTSKDIRIELDPLAICGAISLPNGNGTESSTFSTHFDNITTHTAVATVHHSSWSSSEALEYESDHPENTNPTVIVVSEEGGEEEHGDLRPARKAWPDNHLGDPYPVLPLKSPERLIGSVGFDRGRPTSSERQYQNIINDYAIKFRQEENKYMGHCQTCSLNVDSDDERSTLV